MAEQFGREAFRLEVKQRLLAVHDPLKSAAFANLLALLSLIRLSSAQWHSYKENSEWFASWLFSSLRAILCNEGLILLQSAGKMPAAGPDASSFAFVAAFDTVRIITPACTDAVDVLMVSGLAAKSAARAAIASSDAAGTAADAAASAYGDAYSGKVILSMLSSLESASNVIVFLRQPLPFDLSSLCSNLRDYGRGFEFWAEWLEMRCDGRLIPVGRAEQVLMLSESLLKSPPEVINRYLLDIHSEHAFRALKRVRAIFIGDGGAGKTTLIRVLKEQAFQLGAEAITPGIAIQSWTAPGNDGIKVDFWDFGGQAVAHAMHQFFLRQDCVYVLVSAHS